MYILVIRQNGSNILRRRVETVDWDRMMRKLKLESEIF